MKRIISLLFVLAFCKAFCQDVNVKLTLLATEGGYHSNMSVTLEDSVANTSYKGTTDANGQVTIAVPGNATYRIVILDYTDKKFIDVPDAPGATMTSSMWYSRNMVQEEKNFVMNDAEKKAVDDYANALPDTTWFGSSYHPLPGDHYNYVHITLALTDLHNGPLAGERVTLIGRKRKKAFKGTTDSQGKLVMYLPKGDDYDLSFYYHKNFEFTECKYSRGTSDQEWSFEYIGTKEYERQKKEEQEREAAEAERAKADSVRFAQEIKYQGNGIMSLFDRNNWKNPLVICDASKGMKYIDDDLTAWFSKNQNENPESQFVFFNDGDAKATSEKKIGETGGLYYTPALTLDKLVVFMNSVIDKSTDSDVPDNYVEALIEGVKMAKQPFGDIILIVDNHACARDISLLSQFNHPVHVVVFCSIKGGCDHSLCQPDYLKIAWQTKGTLHIDGLDYNDIGKMRDGESIQVCSSETNYKLVNGEFFRM
ncbi:MAG: hypothetical protein HY064_03865 [Bacteroidetes bacterium]|nr:hypothetical protein [Bacteroidota bacterium]